MTYSDGFILSVIALSVLFAWLRGLSREMITLVAIGVGTGAVMMLAAPLGGMLGSGAIKALAVLSVIFLVAFGIASFGLEVLASSFLGKKPRRADKIAGAVFGIFRGWLIVGLAYLALTYYFPEDGMPESIEDGFLTGVAKSAASALESFGLEREYGGESGDPADAGE